MALSFWLVVTVFRVERVMFAYHFGMILFFMTVGNV